MSRSTILILAVLVVGPIVGAAIDHGLGIEFSGWPMRIHTIYAILLGVIIGSAITYGTVKK